MAYIYGLAITKPLTRDSCGKFPGASCGAENDKCARRVGAFDLIPMLQLGETAFTVPPYDAACIRIDEIVADFHSVGL